MLPPSICNNLCRSSDILDLSSNRWSTGGEMQQVRWSLMIKMMIDDDEDNGDNDDDDDDDDD